MKQGNQLFKKAKRSGNFGQFKLSRNCTVTMLRCAKQNYFRKLNPRDPMTFWKTVKLVNKNNQLIPTLSHDGRIADSDGEKANMLNTFLILALTNHTFQLLSVIFTLLLLSR